MERQFKRQYNETINRFFGPLAAGVTGVSYAPDVFILTQSHSDHLPDLKVLEERLKKQKRETTVYIPILDGDSMLFADVLKRYHAEFLNEEKEDANQKSERDLQGKLAKLQREFDRIKIKTCGQTTEHDGITIEFLRTYEHPSLKYPEPSLAASMKIEKSKQMPICLESEENQIAYVGEAVMPIERIYKIFAELNPKKGEIVLTPPKPNYPPDIRIKSTEEIDHYRQVETQDYEYIFPSLQEILFKISNERKIDLSVHLDPCHAEGILKKPKISTLVQVIPCLEKSPFIEKNDLGMYTSDESYHHYLARLLGRHYELPYQKSKEI